MNQHQGKTLILVKRQVMTVRLTVTYEVGRSFQEKWYQQYSWLEYSKELDAAFCFPRRFFHPKPLRSDKTFTLTGFKD